MINQRLLSRIKGIDWDFPGVPSESKFSAIHWYPGRFASQIPAALIGLLSEPGETVLDPFAGSGTTLVEAQRLRRRSVGIELSPIGALIASGKTLAVSAMQVQKMANELLEHARNALVAADMERRDHISTPAAVQGDKWYAPSVFRHLGALWRVVNEQSGPSQVLARLAFSAVLLPVCRETRHWGYVCDNSTPKSDRVGNVIVAFGEVLARLCDAYAERDAEYRARGDGIAEISSAEVLNGDALSLAPRLPAGGADLVVTSPPYSGVCDYVKAQRLSMEWFGCDIEPLRQLEIGARSKRHRGNAQEGYISEMGAVLRALRRCLRPDGTAAIIVGQSAERQATLPTVLKALKDADFEVRLNVNRRVSSRRRQNPSIRGEHLLIAS